MSENEGQERSNTTEKLTFPLELVIRDPNKTIPLKGDFPESERVIHVIKNEKKDGNTSSPLIVSKVDKDILSKITEQKKYFFDASSFLQPKIIYLKEPESSGLPVDLQDTLRQIRKLQNEIHAAPDSFVPDYGQSVNDKKKKS